MRPRHLPDEGRDEIQSVAVKRLQIPTDSELAERWHISLRWVQHLMRQARKQFVDEPSSDDGAG